MSKQLPQSFKRIALVAKTSHDEGTRIAGELGQWLEQRDLDVHYERRIADSLARTDGFPRQNLPKDTDLVIVIGGDGTFLSVARSAVPLGIPILGVNFGTLGFLTELQPDELYDGVQRVLDGKAAFDERCALRIRHFRGGTLQQEYALLNDAVVTKSALARIINIELKIDGERVADYTSDGLIISSPTGSTAYSLSAGGPILSPQMSAFVITPICPHTMTYRPLVVPGSSTLDVSLRSAGDAVYLTLDGQVGFPFEPEDLLQVDSYPLPARLLRVTDRPFYEILRRKLRWGQR